MVAVEMITLTVEAVDKTLEVEFVAINTKSTYNAITLYGESRFDATSGHALLIH